MEQGDKEEAIYAWIDEIPLSRAKKNISRDFSDGVLMAEIIKHFYPKLVDLHNYYPASSKAFKISNWALLNRKVLSKLEMGVSPDTLKQLVEAVPGVVERLLEELRERVQTKQALAAATNLSDEDKADIFNDSFELSSRDGFGNKQAMVSVPTKSLLKMKREMEEKDEAIGILTDKVSHLETLLALKGQRIKDLSAQLLRYQEAAPSSTSSPEQSH